MMTINLPWPSKDLSPNARGHWSKKASATKKARADGRHATLEVLGRRRMEACALRITTTFFPPTRARYDDDNLMARCKAYFDGIADAIGLDDQHFKHAPVCRGEPRKLGAVRIEIETADAWEHVGDAAARVLSSAKTPERGAA